MRIGPLEIKRTSARNGRRDPVDSDSGYRKTTLDEVVENYDILEVEPTHIVVSERGAKQLADPRTSELGYTGMTHWGSYLREEYNNELRGDAGLQMYDRMRRSDAQVRMSLRIIKTPVIGARWFMEPASNSQQDAKVAEFVHDCLTKHMSISWWQTVLEALLMLDYGFYNFEKVFKLEDSEIRWKKLAPRHPLDIHEIKYDSNGGPRAIVFYAPEEADNSVVIPIEKLLVFTFDKEGGDMRGISALRSAYPHWYIKQNMYKIDAIQKERHGIGIPIIKLPPGYTPADKAKANELGRNLRTNEKAHVVLPPLWDIQFAEFKTQPVNLIESIDHHNDMILNNVMAAFIGMDNENKTAEDMFQKGTRFIAEIIRDVFNKWAIPELVRYNFGDVDIPELKVRRIGDTVDWRTISFAVRNLIGAKVLTPGPELEEWFRDEMDLPPMTKKDIEVAEAQLDHLLEVAQQPVVMPEANGGLGNKQQAAKNQPGLPRQSSADNMRQQAQGTGKSNAGRDTSGGK